MTQIEFTQRTNVNVTYKEFDAINEVYMNSDLDKDEFCKMWCKMNKTRVAKAKAEKKEQEKQNAIRNQFLDILNETYLPVDMTMFAMNFFPEKTLSFFKQNGINYDAVYEYGYWRYPNVGDVLFAIQVKLDLIKIA